jgi:hypothetical protein
MGINLIKDVKVPYIWRKQLKMLEDGKTPMFMDWQN